jgi:hypothetical protein
MFCLLAAHQTRPNRLGSTHLTAWWLLASALAQAPDDDPRVRYIHWARRGGLTLPFLGTAA